MGKRTYNADTLKFIVIAVGLMLAVHFLTDRISAVLAPPPADAPKKEEAVSYGLYGPPEKPRVTVLRNTKTIDVSKPFGMNLPEEALIYAKPPEKEPEKPPVLLAEPQEPPPAPIKNPPKKIHKGPRAKLAVIIDDMGLAANRDKAVVAMPGPLTLAYLPYAPGVARQAQNAKAAGHELLIHTPMEPMNGRIDPGPIALMTDMDEAEFRRVLREDVLPSFEGYVGINNHMGSRLTQDPKAMQWLMEELKAKDLVFVDSITIQSSRAAAVAAQNGVPFARRDVFLDHHESRAAVEKSLREVEARARVQGYAIAIGHPKPNTIAALREWLPGLKDKGFDLVPVSTLLERPWEDEALTAMKSGN